jgi:hypothetical protein
MAKLPVKIYHCKNFKFFLLSNQFEELSIIFYISNNRGCHHNQILASNDKETKRELIGNELERLLASEIQNTDWTLYVIFR